MDLPPLCHINVGRWRPWPLTSTSVQWVWPPTLGIALAGREPHAPGTRTNACRCQSNGSKDSQEAFALSHAHTQIAKGPRQRTNPGLHVSTPVTDSGHFALRRRLLLEVVREEAATAGQTREDTNDYQQPPPMAFQIPHGKRVAMWLSLCPSIAQGVLLGRTTPGPPATLPTVRRKHTRAVRGKQPHAPLFCVLPGWLLSGQPPRTQRGLPIAVPGELCLRWTTNRQLTRSAA